MVALKYSLMWASHNFGPIWEAPQAQWRIGMSSVSGSVDPWFKP